MCGATIPNGKILLIVAIAMLGSGLRDLGAQQAGRGGQQPVSNTGPFTPPAGTKIEPVVMAPLEQGAQFVVSPHGVHVATLSRSGSRAVVIYDGIPGPKFDEIFPGPTGVVGVTFSPDGKRYGYCGKSGKEFVAMIDGKEMGRGSETDPQGIVSAGSCAIGFTPGSKHAYYTSGVGYSGHTVYRFAYDGKVSPVGASSDLREYTFSPDDDHYTYPWTDPPIFTIRSWWWMGIRLPILGANLSGARIAGIFLQRPPLPTESPR